MNLTTNTKTNPLTNISLQQSTTGNNVGFKANTLNVI